MSPDHRQLLYESIDALVLTGPTAVGKTSLSLALADALDAEIISADSRQIYHELTIGTAKPDLATLDSIPHHFINELHLPEVITAGGFAEQAIERIRQIRQRGRFPLVVGGSTLYVYALTHGLAPLPKSDPVIREALNQRLLDVGADRLYRELELIDPAAASSMDATKTQRLLRALEVFELTGKPISFFQQQTPTAPLKTHTLVLHRDKASLNQRIHTRIDHMLNTGLIAEVRQLLQANYDFDISPLRTIGYREVYSFLQGHIEYDRMVDQLCTNTRRYAKRQRTWFRRFKTYEHYPIEGSSIPGLLGGIFAALELST